MKKTFKKPDGTEEIIEGTPEEIAEYERQVRERLGPSKKPSPSGFGILKGAPAVDWSEFVKLLPVPAIYPYQPIGQTIWMVPCTGCGYCNCMCGSGYLYKMISITCNTTFPSLPLPEYVENSKITANS
jgi:ferredoxin